MADYYTTGSDPADGSDLDSSVIRAEWASLAAGFAKIAGYTGAANRVPHINSGATSMTTTSGFTFDGTTFTAPALAVTNAATFNGAVTLGNAAADNITVTGTVTSNLIFTDATYDIGASGATRPRDLFLSRNAVIGSALTYGGVTLTAAVTGTGKMVLDTSPTLVTPLLGTPTSGTLTNCTGLPLTTGITGTLGAANGGTGVANNAASTLTISGSFATTLTITGITGVTLPTTGTLATLAGTEELDNKTLDSSVGKGTWTASGTWTLPAFTLGGTVTANGQVVSGVLGLTSPAITTSITTASTTFTAFAGATTLLTIGGTGATSVVAIPGTKASTSSTTGAVTVAGGIGVAGNSFYGAAVTAAGQIKSTADGTQFWAEPATNTFYARSVYKNAGGTLSVGIDNSAGSIFGGAAYGTTIERPAATTFAVTRAGTVDFSLSATGAAAFTGTLGVTGIITATAGTYIGSASTNNQIDDASNGSGSTTLYIGNASINVTSDEKLKSNIIPLADGLSIVNALQPIEYDQDEERPWGDVRHYVGFGARHSHKIAPWTVNTQGDTGLPWKMRQEFLMAPVVRAIQQLDQRVRALEAK